ncbi:hypothetical protein OSSY52_21360 [Tepiditoga spiralis]|uniref:CYTH domain-containing protein n=1 Tax=Tepiditoga spiralis TaxID=2108365 RepID=A0A7G1G711_9BACT|nr:hypothetical protein [Tepiditoga spiralis]BBE31995.1 hypothetical protein OSSY52_21360 [Tepiditoga spiralis]
MIEKEKKYILNEKNFKRLIKNAIKYSVIIQWYNEKNERIRVEILNNEELWTKNIKIPLNELKRIEKEYKISKPNMDSLKDFKVVIKKRYYLFFDPEIIIDEILNPKNSIKYKNYEKIRYLLEIEEKSKRIDSFDNYIKNKFDFLPKAANFSNYFLSEKCNISPEELLVEGKNV